MTTKTKLALVLSVVLFASIFLAGTVSAGGSWKRTLMINNLLSSSSDYDIMWEGPYQGGTLFVTMRGGNQNSALSGLNINAENIDRLDYEKRDRRNYDRRGGYPNYGYGGYGGYGRYGWYGGYGYGGRGYGGGDSRHSRDNYEKLRIDNTQSNRYKYSRPIYVFASDTPVSNANTNWGISSHPRYDSKTGTINWKYSDSRG